MEFLTHRFSLDVNETAAQVSIACKKNDTAIRLIISLTDRGTPYEITEGCVAIFTATKADGKFLYNYCRIEKNTIVYDFTPQTVSCTGKADCEIRLSDGENILTSPEFILIVDETVVDGSSVDSEGEANALDGLVAAATLAIENAEAATDNALVATESAVTAAEDAVAAKESAVSATENAAAAAENANNAADKANGAAAGVVTIEQNQQKPLKFWVGTKAEYEAMIPEDNVFYIFTDSDELYTIQQIARETAQQVANPLNMYPVGSQYIASSADVDPADLFGGTWELVDKGFKNYSGNSADEDFSKDFFTKGSKTTDVSAYCSRAGATVRIRLAITSEATFIDEGATILGSLNFKTFGFESLPMGYFYALAATDYAEGALMVNVAWDSGQIEAVEVLGGKEGKITSEHGGKYYPYYIDLTFTVKPDNMLNEFCDKFYWKRIA